MLDFRLGPRLATRTVNKKTEITWSYGFEARPFTKPPLFRRNSSPEAVIQQLKVRKREKLCRGKLKCTAGAPFKNHITVQLYIGTADQNWFSVVMLNLEFPVYTEFPCLKIFPLHNFQKRDCPRILAHTFGIRLLSISVLLLAVGDTGAEGAVGDGG